MERLAASKTPTQTLYKFKSSILFGVWPAQDKRTTVDVEVTDANVNERIDDSGHDVTIWFGCLDKSVVLTSTPWDARESRYRVNIAIAHRGKAECYANDNEWIKKDMGHANSLNFDNLEEAERANKEIQNAHQAWFARYGDISVK